MLSCDSGFKSVASRTSFLEELSKHWSCSGSEGQFTGSHIDYSFLASDVRSLGAVEVTAADTGISLWVRDDGTVLISVCLRITDISIPDLTLKIFECRLFAICISPSTCSHRCAFCLRAHVDSFELIFN